MIKLKDCRRGRMMYFAGDTSVGRSLEVTGEYGEGEVELFEKLLRPGDVVVEAGANIGSHTVPIAQAVGPEGFVLAFEPQRPIYQVLCGNLALNELWQVTPLRAGLGAEKGVTSTPVVDYRGESNLGGVCLQASPDWLLNATPIACEKVQIDTLDSFSLPRCNFIKADVEGMELQVLRGAASTIRQHRPLLYLETNGPRASRPLFEHLMALEYACFWHLSLVYYIDRDYVSFNVFAAPKERSVRCNLPVVNDPGDCPPLSSGNPWSTTN